MCETKFSAEMALLVLKILHITLKLGETTGVLSMQMAVAKIGFLIK